MKAITLTLIFLIIFKGVAQNPLPNLVDVNIQTFDRLIEYENLSLSDAINSPDQTSSEITDCNYTLDFINKKCMLFFEGQMIANVNILEIKQNENILDILLEDGSDETKIIIDLNNKSFIYYYRFIDRMEITIPTKFSFALF
jgi:hypothetical protein